MAGPRASKAPGIHGDVMDILENALLKKATSRKPLSCPFCGAAPVINSYIINGVKFWNVGVKMMPAWSMLKLRFETEYEAVTAWNQRV